MLLAWSTKTQLNYKSGLLLLAVTEPPNSKKFPVFCRNSDSSQQNGIGRWLYSPVTVSEHKTRCWLLPVSLPHTCCLFGHTQLSPYAADYLSFWVKTRDRVNVIESCQVQSTIPETVELKRFAIYPVAVNEMQMGNGMAIKLSDWDRETLEISIAKRRRLNQF